MQCRPQSLLKQHRKFGGDNCHRNVDQQKHRSQRGEQPENYKSATDDLHHSHKGSGELSPGNADLRETACTQGNWKEELLDTLGEKDPTYEDANYQDAPGEAA